MMAAMLNDEWVRAAMTDDSVVVELLVRLKKQSHHVAQSAATLTWGIRQRRSRSTRCDAVSMRRKDGADSACNSMRASPTTPLSWSGDGGSPSTTADDGTSRHQTYAFRSKGIATKRPRKKKTFAELKEEEGLLVKERIHLNKELETLRFTYKIQSARNENLKRIKLDMGLDSGNILSEMQACNGSDSSSSSLQQSGSCGVAHEAVPARNSLCVLPDLNMMPDEDDCAC